MLERRGRQRSGTHDMALPTFSDCMLLGRYTRSYVTPAVKGGQGGRTVWWEAGCRATGGRRLSQLATPPDPAAACSHARRERRPRRRRQAPTSVGVAHDVSRHVGWHRHCTRPRQRMQPGRFQRPVPAAPHHPSSARPPAPRAPRSASTTCRHPARSSGGGNGIVRPPGAHIWPLLCPSTRARAPVTMTGTSGSEMLPIRKILPSKTSYNTSNLRTGGTHRGISTSGA